MPYPEQLELLRDLVVNDHVALDDEPLLLAVYYASEASPNEECLFEVARNFGYGGPDEDKHIFQIEFGPSPKFLLPEGRHLVTSRKLSGADSTKKCTDVTMMGKRKKQGHFWGCRQIRYWLRYEAIRGLGTSSKV